MNSSHIAAAETIARVLANGRQAFDTETGMRRSSRIDDSIIRKSQPIPEAADNVLPPIRL